MIRNIYGHCLNQLLDSLEYLFQFVCCIKVLIMVGTFCSLRRSGFVCTVIGCRLFFYRSFCLNFCWYHLRLCFYNLSWLRFSNNNWSFYRSGFWLSNWLRNRIRLSNVNVFWLLVRLLLNNRCFYLLFRCLGTPH